MAVLGVAKIDSIVYDSAGNFGVNISYVGCDTVAASGISYIGGIAANVSTAIINTAISSTVKSILISNWGYSFGLLDYVAVLGVIL